MIRIIVKFQDDKLDITKFQEDLLHIGKTLSKEPNCLPVRIIMVRFRFLCDFTSLLE